MLDEERRIGQRLAELARISGLHEVIVVDGGSRDRTVAIARDAPGVRVFEVARGRGGQLNAGARAATGDVLLFLHADVSLPDDAVAWIEQAFADPAIVAAAFRTWTVPDAAPTWLGPLLHLADLRSRYTSLPYGDQAVSVRRETFEVAGGFPAEPLMEDLAFAQKIRRLGRIVTVPASVRVSGRRFIARPIWYTFLVNVYPLLYRLGVPPRVLAQLYRDQR